LGLSEAILLSILLACCLSVFWFLQWRTGFFSTRYYAQIGGLLLIATLAALTVISWRAYGEIGFIVGVMAACVAAYHSALFGFKLLLDTDNKYRWIHKANRALVNYDQPHQRLTFRTQDGVKIQAIRLTTNSNGNGNGNAAHKKAVIVCHGAGRSKNTMSIVQTCAILATKYDVFAFDFRGHMESGGIFRANGDTEKDLVAMLEHIHRAGYEKIAVVGWSVGATTALLAAANGAKIDAIIAGAPPPVNLSEYKHLQLLQRMPVIQFPGGSAAAASRYMRVVPGTPLMNALDFAGQVPPIPILLVYNDFDTTLKVDASAFEALSAKLPATTETMRLPGSGHLFDWPNTFFFWTKMLDWLERNF
jgi:pimeloyl-ACP methyl ester carboxylesterase